MEISRETVLNKIGELLGRPLTAVEAEIVNLNLATQNAIQAIIHEEIMKQQTGIVLPTQPPGGGVVDFNALKNK